MQLIFTSSPLITAVVGSVIMDEPWPPKLWETLGLTLVGSGGPPLQEFTIPLAPLQTKGCLPMMASLALTSVRHIAADKKACTTSMQQLQSELALKGTRIITFLIAILRPLAAVLVVWGGLRSSDHVLTWRDPLGIAVRFGADAAAAARWKAVV